MFCRSLPVALLLVLMLAAAPLHAHDTWLAPSRYHAAAAGPVTLSLSSGMEFPKLDHAIAADRVDSATWRTARDQGELPTGTAAAHALELRANAGAGVTAFAVVLHARPSKLKREQVREYIDHLQIPNAKAVYEMWEQSPKKDETGYRYMKYATTFVRVGRAESRVWADPAGMRLELIPRNDPTSVTAGAMLGVILLDRGKPLPRYPVSLLHEGAKEPVRVFTDDEGYARIALPEAGRYMLLATVLEPSADAASAWDVHFTTMTFEAGAR